MKKVKTITSKERPLRQKAFAEFNKAKDLILHSIKFYAKSKREDTVTVSKARLAKAKRIKKGDVKTFNQMFYDLTRQDKLRIDSKSEKLLLCKHARARNHVFNQIARAINRLDLYVDYTKAKTTKKKVTLKK